MTSKTFIVETSDNRQHTRKSQTRTYTHALVTTDERPGVWSWHQSLANARKALGNRHDLVIVECREKEEGEKLDRPEKWDSIITSVKTGKKVKKTVGRPELVKNFAIEVERPEGSDLCTIHAFVFFASAEEMAKNVAKWTESGYIVTVHEVEVKHTPYKKGSRPSQQS